MIISTIQLRKTKLPVSILIFIIEASLLLIGIIWMFVRRIPVFDDIKITSGAIIMGVIAGFAILASSAIFHLIDRVLFQLRMKNLIENYIYPVFSKISLPEILLIAVMSGFCEEFFFRGILMKEFGIITASIVFGLLHTANRETWFMGVWSALAGFVFGLLYIKTGNLFIPMVAHAVNNFIAISYVKFIYLPMKEKLEDIEGGIEEKDDTGQIKEELPCDEKMVIHDEATDEEAYEDEIDSPVETHPSKESKTIKEEKPRKVSSPVQLLDPTMIEGKIPTSKKVKIPEPDYDPMPRYKEGEQGIKQAPEVDFDSLPGKKKPERLEIDMKKSDNKKQDKKDKKTADKDKQGKDRRADDLNDEGIGIINEPQ
ncbi:MAG: CPBP family intramembrane metalloprotease [Candidatus Eremiobacteraeota bacterium]|nr:CPBP family intramembrane metalloprotease [Candidatus Eremiobacteraeota bacterium]